MITAVYQKPWFDLLTESVNLSDTQTELSRKDRNPSFPLELQTSPDRRIEERVGRVCKGAIRWP